MYIPGKYERTSYAATNRGWKSVLPHLLRSPARVTTSLWGQQQHRALFFGFLFLWVPQSCLLLRVLSLSLSVFVKTNATQALPSFRPSPLALWSPPSPTARIQYMYVYSLRECHNTNFFSIREKPRETTGELTPREAKKKRPARQRVGRNTLVSVTFTDG